MNLKEYGIEIIDGSRYYTLDLNNDSAVYENITPNYCYYKGELVDIGHKSLTGLIVSLFNFFYEGNKLDDSVFLNYSTDWSDVSIFTKYKRETASHKLVNDLYVNLNYNATLLIRIIKIILELFNVDKADLKIFIYKSPSIENKQVLDYVYKLNSDCFKKYLLSTGINEKDLNTYENNINVISNKPRIKAKYYFINLFYIDNRIKYASIKSKILKDLEVYGMDFVKRCKITLDKYTEYLSKKINIYKN